MSDRNNAAIVRAACFGAMLLAIACNPPALAADRTRPDSTQSGRTQPDRTRIALSVPPAALPSLPALVETDPFAVETVRFSDPRHSPVRIVRGLKTATFEAPASIAVQPPPAAAEAIPAPRRQIVSFGSGFADQVTVMRGSAGGGALPVGVARAIPPGTTTRVEKVAFTDPRHAPVNVVRGEVPRTNMSFTIATPVISSAGYPAGLFDAASGGELDRVAFAVDGVESRHGADARMWRPELSGPQGPMQVSAAAAFDVGGGDRFDMRQNRLLGRAYLAQMFQRYGNWPDAIAAYNWGPGNMDQWIAGGRTVERLPIGVVRYTNRVLRDSLLNGSMRL